MNLADAYDDSERPFTWVDMVLGLILFVVGLLLLPLILLAPLFRRRHAG